MTDPDITIHDPSTDPDDYAPYTNTLARFARRRDEWTFEQVDSQSAYFERESDRIVVYSWLQTASDGRREETFRIASAAYEPADEPFETAADARTSPGGPPETRVGFYASHDVGDFAVFRNNLAVQMDAIENARSPRHVVCRDGDLDAWVPTEYMGDKVADNHTRNHLDDDGHHHAVVLEPTEYERVKSQEDYL